MNNITFNDLPQAITQLFDKVAHIEQLLIENSDNPAAEKDELLTVEETAQFLKLTVPTVYTLISRGEIPVMKRSKRCYFLKADLIAYLKAGRKKSNSEVAAEAEFYSKVK